MKIKVQCLNCGKEFEKFPSEIKRGEGKYCSVICIGLAHTGENSPVWKGGPVCYEKRKRENNPIRMKAKDILHQAVRTGKIKPLPCAKCNYPKSQGHHEDYSKPLEVIWLCDLHHKEVHGRLKELTYA